MSSAPDASADGYLLFESVRWPDGRAACPHCGSGRCRNLSTRDGAARRTRTGRVSHRRVWRCGECRRQFSVLTGTVFEGTRVPLPVWLRALAALDGGRADAGRVAAVTGVDRGTARAMAQLVAGGLSAAGAAADGAAGAAQPQG